MNATLPTWTIVVLAAMPALLSGAFSLGVVRMSQHGERRRAVKAGRRERLRSIYVRVYRGAEGLWSAPFQRGLAELRLDHVMDVQLQAGDDLVNARVELRLEAGTEEVLNALDRVGNAARDQAHRSQEVIAAGRDPFNDAVWQRHHAVHRAMLDELQQAMLSSLAAIDAA